MAAPKLDGEANTVKSDATGIGGVFKKKGGIHFAEIYSLTAKWSQFVFIEFGRSEEKKLNNLALKNQPEC